MFVFFGGVVFGVCCFVRSVWHVGIYCVRNPLEFRICVGRVDFLVSFEHVYTFLIGGITYGMAWCSIASVASWTHVDVQL